MSYNDVATLAVDPDFRVRVAASYATEPGVTMHPLSWTDSYQWTIASAPGFGAAYASAIAGDVPNPGKDESVISDAMILGAVQALLAAQAGGEPSPV